MSDFRNRAELSIANSSRHIHKGRGFGSDVEVAPIRMFTPSQEPLSNLGVVVRRGISHRSGVEGRILWKLLYLPVLGRLLDLLGLRDGVFPGVVLLSRRR